MAQETKTYTELMKGIAICHSDEAFKTLTDGKDAQYVGCDALNTKWGDTTTKIYRVLGCKFEQATLEERFWPRAAQDSCFLWLAQKGKAQGANLMRVIQHGFTAPSTENFSATVEFWYISGE